MGYWYGAFVEATTEEMKGNPAFPFHAVRFEPGCGFVAIDDYYFEDEPPEELAELSETLGRRVLGMCGHTVSTWVHVAVFEGGERVRLVEYAEQWQLEGDAVQPWESYFVDKLVRDGVADEDMNDAGRAIAATGLLQTGARFPICDVHAISEALNLGGLLWGGGERVVTHQRRGFSSRLLGR